MAADSISVRFAPLDSGGADRAYTVGLREKINRHAKPDFFHTWDRLWLGYYGYIVSLPGPARSSDWTWAYNDDIFDVRPIQLVDSAKQIRIKAVEPPWPTSTYDFSEYLK